MCSGIPQSSDLRLSAHLNKVHNAVCVEEPTKPLLLAEHDATEKMDPEQIESELIYAKTTSGEEAMLQRTRVVQRNLRMVLILVDGNATVAELCDKTGNEQLTRSALLELENDGFIERRIEEDSVWARGRRLARQIKERAAQPLSEFSTFGKKADVPPVRHSVPNADADANAEADADVDADADTSRLVPAPEESLKRFSLGLPSSPPLPAPSSPPTSSVTGPESRTVFFNKEDDVSQAATPLPENTAEQAPSLIDRARSFLGGASDDARAGEGPDLKPLRRRTLHLTWPMATMLGAAVLSALLVLAALFFPYSLYLPAVERALTESTGETVSVEEMRVTIYPRPALLLAHVRVGNAAAEEQIHIPELRLRPEVSTLFSQKIIFGEMQLNDLDLSAKAFGALSRMFAAAATSRNSARFAVQRVIVSDADISFAGLGFDDLSGELALSADGLLESVSLKSADRSMQIEAQPVADKLTVVAEGRAWRPSRDSPYRFDSFNFKGDIAGPEFIINEMDLRIFSGRISGTVTLRADGQPSIMGEIAFERISAKRFGAALGIGEQFDGDLAGDLRFSARSNTWYTLMHAVYAEGDFTVNRGSLGGIDLPEAVRRFSTNPATLGGATRFENLTGAIRLTPKHYRFSRLLLHAGTMQSSGQIEVSSDLQLRGRMEVRMRGHADPTIPVSISGSLKTPLLESK
ncbi:MAG: putative protein involved in outer membrane biogenesis [Candidatus Accumulibacter appositus]|uniref:AsmA-like C-terminal domain-containing protein n=2 Tax=Candidatus Accumulibacter TaxID=327159 RepID=A0A011NY73_9PROT|nr:MAG: putative protein involved in outer membrane biogenesis [Candidatus Accumulibacter appositus]